jgi:hypothetical protein
MSSTFGGLRDTNPALYRIVRRYRDPITGLIDWDAVNREYDYIDFHTSPYTGSQFNTQTQVERSLGLNACDCPSGNEQAWAERQLEAGISESGVLERLS